MDNSLISIIIPIYNVERYLTECIESIIKQTYSNLEIILVNDGSTDNSLDICKEYAKLDARIKIIDKTNGGISDARNVGIQFSTGNYIMFVDSDDWIDSDTCEILIEMMKKHSCDVVMGGYTREFENKSLEKRIFNNDMVFNVSECKDLHRRLFGLLDNELEDPESAESLCPVWMKLYKSDLIKKNNIIFEDIKKIGTYEDGIFNIHVFEYVKKAVFINKPLYHYRKTNTNSITSKYKPNLEQQWNCLFNMMEEYIKINNLDHKYKQALNNRISMSILVLGMNICSNGNGMISNIFEIKNILNTPRFKKSYKDLSIKYFPLHWKLFYGFAKYNSAIGVYFLLLVINKMVGRR